MGEEDVYYLRFVQENRRKIAYAASLGLDTFEGYEFDTLMLAYSLRRFHALSVREKGGVDLIQKIAKLSATHVLDPVFLLDSRKYMNFIHDTTQTNEIVAYILSDEIRQKVTEPSYNISDIRFGLSVEQWLEKIYKSKYVVTDSFHCICFCIIFKKTFCVITKKDSAVERILSLFELLQIPTDKILICPSELTYQDIENSLIIPKDCTDILNDWKIKSENWLMNAITGHIEKADISTNLSYKEDLIRAKRRKKILKIKKVFSFGKRKKKIKEELKNVKKYISFLKKN